MRSTRLCPRMSIELRWNGLCHIATRSCLIPSPRTSKRMRQSQGRTTPVALAFPAHDLLSFEFQTHNLTKFFLIAIIVPTAKAHCDYLETATVAATTKEHLNGLAPRSFARTWPLHVATKTGTWSTEKICAWGSRTDGSGSRDGLS
jgi:hypothetical protein